MAHHATTGSDRAERATALGIFHPLTQRWFLRRIGNPTEVQGLAWPRIAAGKHVLVTAPTGSGKTLAAFLWSLDRLLTGAWSGGRVRVLYVSPLRALNTDIRNNLLRPLSELESDFRSAGIQVPSVRVQTRSGDTPSSERQRMIRSPPEILITTPETLNILLTSKGGRSILGALRCVILDEIHAVAGGKRGTHLMTAIERLTLLSGEFQRLALSATVRPLDRIARFVGGHRLISAPAGEDAIYERRQLEVISGHPAKRYELEVRSKLQTVQTEPAGAAVTVSVWEPLVAELRASIRRHRSTLLFANSRRLTEKLTRLLNEGEGRDLAYSHHGSLSREIRSVVEERLKQGRLSAIVATSSLELGIDIGSLDRVILVQTPPSIAAAIQRLGRAGHAVGEVSRGSFMPLYPRDLLDAIAVAMGVLAQDIEETRPVRAPLDVLAQVVLSMVSAEPWKVEDLYRFVRSAEPYRRLARQQFDLVLDMLAGRYADHRIRELDPRVTLDRIDGTVRARPGARQLIYSSGGTIPDRGYFHLRLQDGLAKLGELDEEFVWERSVGDTFTLGAQSWQITGITHNDVLVRPAPRSSAMAPFWRAEERSRSFHLSERIAELLERADSLLGQTGGPLKLRHRLQAETIGEQAVTDLLHHLEQQRAATHRSLPHRHHLLIERLASEAAGEGLRQVIVHTLWGGQVNRPMALAMAAAWEEEHDEPLQIEHDNDCLMLLLPEAADPRLLLGRVRPDNVERLLRQRLEQGGFFGARFRENAGRALLLPRGSFRRRVPLWFNRQRAKQLLSAVRRYEDFPIVMETWRTCLQDDFDLESLAKVLTELESGEIVCSEVSTTSPSPFAAEIVWKRTQRLMYEDDTPAEAGPSRLRHDLLRELLHGGRLRPRVPAALIDRLERKLQRTFPGYAPQDAQELIHWVRERIALPAAQWAELLDAVQRDGGLCDAELEDVVLAAASRLLRLGARPGADAELVVHWESVPRLAEVFGYPAERLPTAALVHGIADSNPAWKAAEASEAAPGAGYRDPLVDLVSEWIRFYGPFRRSLLSEDLGLEESRVEEVLETLVSEERVVIDHFRDSAREEDELEICDIENLERLLRLLRAEARVSFEARPLSELPLMLAHQQGLITGGGDPERLKSVLERLFGYPAVAHSWEAEILPARLDPYYTAWLDGLFHDTDLSWLGCGQRQITFSLQSDLELFQDLEPLAVEARARAAGEIFPERPGRYALEELLAGRDLDASELSRRLWQLVWKGGVSNTTFEVVRRAVVNRYRPPRRDDERRGLGRSRSRRGLRRRARFERWGSSRPSEGDWYPLETSSIGGDALDALEVEELNKDRVRVLLQRYGVLFRELLARELQPLSWGRLFRTLRLMELSGEVLSGQFFEGIAGVQFISPEGLRSLRSGLPEDAVFWLNAADPASLCGLGLPATRGKLPTRRASTHLVYHGSKLVVISQRHGGELEVREPPEHPKMPEYLQFLKVLLGRRFAPRRAITVKTINGEAAVGSPYLPSLAGQFLVSKEPQGVKLRRRL